MMPDIMDAQPSLAEVQPGGTITLECAYSLQDTANPITVQVGPLMSITNEVNAQIDNLVLKTIDKYKQKKMFSRTSFLYFQKLFSCYNK